MFVVGSTESSLGGVNAGGYDGYIAKFNATSGFKDAEFGDGDGSDNDGLKINSMLVVSSFFICSGLLKAMFPFSEFLS